MADGNFNPAEFKSVQEHHARRAWAIPIEEIDLAIPGPSVSACAKKTRSIGALVRKKRSAAIGP